MRKKKDQGKNLKVVLRIIAVILIMILSFMIYNKNKGEDNMTYTIKTNKGNMKIELYEQKAPITTQNFKDLVNENFYDGILFHRVEPGFVIQVGYPQTKTLPLDDPRIGTGGSGKTIPLEVSPELKHNSSGVLSMARTMDPNSATSQFFITLDATPHLDMQYAVFGKVIKGLDVVKKIEVGDKIITITKD
ncbi:peptidylprolyl isomerase [Candidatus Woesearchaeota archaeon]|nr:MAG: peptidylprolyl isomerase [Candidatus Woesearchaeota archaeon]